MNEASAILAEIQKAKSILLHCHPSPDPDSVGSALAMKFALEQLGKKATVIRGDSVIPQAFMHFPGAKDIVPKSFGEVDLKEFDLFIVLDSSKTEMISRISPVVFPEGLKVIVIDHHDSNTGFGMINLILPSYPATAQILFELFKQWKLDITPNIGADLFIGIYTDTGGFRYSDTTAKTFSDAAELVGIVPDFSKIISVMENNKTLDEVRFQGLALSSIETFLNGTLGISAVSYASSMEKNIPEENLTAGMISAIIRGIPQFHIVGALIETGPQRTKASFRSRDGNMFDVSKLAVAIGGGGHKAAAGALLNMPLDEAKKLVVAKAKELYNL